MPDPRHEHVFLAASLVPNVVFSGPDIEFVLEMVADVLRYTAGPGLPGFMEWLRAKYTPAGSPEPPLSGEDIARHVGRCAEKFEQALGTIQS